MGDNTKGKLKVALPPGLPPNMVGHLTITAFTDRPPTTVCSGDLVMAMRLLAAGASSIAAALEQAYKKPADPLEDKKREYLGPREG